MEWAACIPVAEGRVMHLPDFLSEVSPGEIRLTGHRIGLYSIIRMRREGLSAEEMVEEMPSLELEQVRKVLAFHDANRAEVDAYGDAYQAELDRQERAYVPGPS